MVGVGGCPAAHEARMAAHKLKVLLVTPANRRNKHGNDLCKTSTDLRTGRNRCSRRPGLEPDRPLARRRWVSDSVLFRVVEGQAKAAERGCQSARRGVGLGFLDGIGVPAPTESDRP